MLKFLSSIFYIFISLSAFNTFNAFFFFSEEIFAQSSPKKCSDLFFHRTNSEKNSESKVNQNLPKKNISNNKETPFQVQSYARLTSRPPHFQNQLLKTLLEEARKPWPFVKLSGNWVFLMDPQFEIRPHGLQVIQNKIKESNLYVVIPKRKPIEENKLEKNKLIYGENILYALEETSSLQSEHIKGLVLHPSYVGQEIEVLNAFRGDINPHLGFGFLHERLSQKKLREYETVESIWPGAMPESISYAQLNEMAKEKPEKNPNFNLNLNLDQVQNPKEFQENVKKLETSRISLLNYLNGIHSYTPELSLSEKNNLLERVTLHMETFFKMVNSLFKEGAFIKNFNETQTGDFGTQITSFSEDGARKYASQFVDSIVYRLEGNHNPQLRSEGAVRKRLNEEHLMTGNTIIRKLLRDPSDILIQKKLELAKTDFNFPLEIRVDFLDGMAVNSSPRYTHEYLGPECREAEKVLNMFFAKAPEEFQMISGGADLAKLQGSGEWVIIELNVGQNSGFTIAEHAPIEANIFLSRLLQGTGKANPPLIRSLDEAFVGGPSSQISFIKNLMDQKGKRDQLSIDDLPAIEVAKYFRDKYLQEWEKNPSKKNADLLMKNLNELFSFLFADTQNKETKETKEAKENQKSPSSQEKEVSNKKISDLSIALKSAENYLKKKLSSSNAAQSYH